MCLLSFSSFGQQKLYKIKNVKYLGKVIGLKQLDFGFIKKDYDTLIIKTVSGSKTEDSENENFLCLSQQFTDRLNEVYLTAAETSTILKGVKLILKETPGWTEDLDDHVIFTRSIFYSNDYFEVGFSPHRDFSLTLYVGGKRPNPEEFVLDKQATQSLVKILESAKLQ